MVKVSSFLMLILFTLSACVSEEIIDSYTPLVQENDFNWNALHLRSDGHLIAAGGRDWYGYCMAEISPDTTIYISGDSAQSEFRVISDWNQTDILIMGLAGSCAYYSHDTDNWELTQFNGYKSCSALLIGPDGRGIVSASSYRDSMVQYNFSFPTWWEINYREKKSILSAQDFAIAGDKILACGFGYIAVSNDFGKMWSYLEPTDEFFIDIAANDSNAYVLGSKGRVIRYSIQTGKTEEIRKSNSTFSSIREFNGISVNEQGEIYIVGEQGRVYYSKNGKEWSPMIVDTETRLNAVAQDRNSLYLAGDDGFLVKIEKF